MSGWSEVADRVYRCRYDPYDVGVCAVRGADGLLLVDTRASHLEADEIRDDLRALDRGPVRAVVNTHAHFDHTFGNMRFGPGSDLDVPIYGYELVPAHLDDYEVPKLASLVEADPAGAWRDVVITPPTVLVGGRTVLDLGDRTVELLHLGRGHTDNDLVLHVADADVWLAGDLLEESGPPMYGSGAFPLDWPVTVAALCDLVDESPGAVVPGHGAVVDPQFARRQQTDLQTVAHLVRELHAAGVAVEDAVREGGDRWPFPPDGLETAVRDGYRQLAARP